MSVRRSRARRHTVTADADRPFSLAEMRAQVRDTDRECHAIFLAGIGVSMRCLGPCARCEAWDAETARLRPVLEAQRAEAAENDPRRKRPVTEQEDNLNG